MFFPNGSSSKSLELLDCSDLKGCSSNKSHVFPHCSSSKPLDLPLCSNGKPPDLPDCSINMSHVLSKSSIYFLKLLHFS